MPRLFCFVTMKTYSASGSSKQALFSITTLIPVMLDLYCINNVMYLSTHTTQSIYRLCACVYSLPHLVCACRHQHLAQKINCTDCQSCLHTMMAEENTLKRILSSPFATLLYARTAFGSRSFVSYGSGR